MSAVMVPPSRYADVPLEWGKWRRVTTRLDTGEVTWAFGWGGRCLGRGKAGSADHALRRIERRAAAVLDDRRRR